MADRVIKVITFEMQDGRVLVTPPLEKRDDGSLWVAFFPELYRGEWYEALMWAGLTRHTPYDPSIRQRGMTPWCECGWHPTLEDGRLLAAHIAEQLVS